MKLRYDLASSGIMGFTEVVRSFPAVVRLFRETCDHLRQARPDCLVVIDYPGFNIRLAKYASGLGIPVVYYISPQVWAWKKGRIHTIARSAEKVLVILPFEEPLYSELGVDCVYVGHPLVDHIPASAYAAAPGNRLLIGLLPGSREQEIRRLLAPMLEVAEGIQDAYPEAEFVTPCVDEVRQGQVRALAGDFPLVTVIGKTCEVLGAARFCLVASGTATLEAALIGVPMIIMYKVSPLSHWIARRVVHIENIGLVNILAGRRIVPEFLQHEIRSERVLPAALELIDDTPARERMLRDLAEVRDTVGPPGASERAAEEIVELLGRKASHG